MLVMHMTFNHTKQSLHLYWIVSTIPSILSQAMRPNWRSTRCSSRPRQGRWPPVDPAWWTLSAGPSGTPGTRLATWARSVTWWGDLPVGVMWYDVTSVVVTWCDVSHAMPVSCVSYQCFVHGWVSCCHGMALHISSAIGTRLKKKNKYQWCCSS